MSGKRYQPIKQKLTKDFLKGTSLERKSEQPDNLGKDAPPH